MSAGVLSALFLSGCEKNTCVQCNISSPSAGQPSSGGSAGAGAAGAGQGGTNSSGKGGSSGEGGSGGLAGTGSGGQPQAGTGPGGAGGALLGASGQGGIAGEGGSTGQAGQDGASGQQGEAGTSGQSGQAGMATAGASGAGAAGGPGCGNGVQDAGEACDGADFGGATCASVVGGAWTGALFCDGMCATLSAAGCTSPSAKPSCSGLAKTCGLTGKDDCCAVDSVPGGTFLMGRSTDGADKFSVDRAVEQPEHGANVAAFALDRHEVTVGRFRKFVTAYDAFRATLKEGMGAHPFVPGSGWQDSWTVSLPVHSDELRKNLKCDVAFQTWTDQASGNDNKPVNCVTWYEAFAFCLWDGGRLPTEVEWEYAAAGGSENRLYPWGSQEPNISLAIHNCLFAGGGTCESSDLPPVGSAPTGKGKWGHLDLGGSLWEWTFDRYDPSWYSNYASSQVCDGCANVSVGADRGFRGGSFGTSPAGLRSAYREGTVPAAREAGVGLRCARN